MLVTFEVPNKLPSEDELLSLEQTLGASLPEEYREFLQSINGGTPNHRDDLVCTVYWDGQDWADPIEENGINYFYHIGEQNRLSEGLDLEYNIETFVVGKRIPKDTFPIANDAMGNQYLLSFNDEDYGHVYFWQKDFEKIPDDQNEPDFSNVAVVTESFSEFINSFEISE